MSELEPEGELESLLVDRVAACAWRLRRLLRIETGIFTRDVYTELAQRAQAKAARFVHTQPLFDDPFGQSYERQRSPTERHTPRPKEVADEAVAIRDSPDALLGLAFVKDATGPDALSKLSRYETTLERAMYRALAELGAASSLPREAHAGAHGYCPPRSTSVLADASQARSRGRRFGFSRGPEQILGRPSLEHASIGLPSPPRIECERQCCLRPCLDRAPVPKALAPHPGCWFRELRSL